MHESIHLQFGTVHFLSQACPTQKNPSLRRDSPEAEIVGKGGSAVKEEDEKIRTDYADRIETAQQGVSTLSRPERSVEELCGWSF